MSGESNVSVNLADGEKPQVNVSLYPDGAARFEAKVLSSGVPLLKIEHGSAEVRVWPHVPTQITGNDVATARRLVASATAYLAEVERIHAERAATAA
ncbi:hypothetical protein GCM10027176_31080 [Actinoallomurus bryophytorum]|uniref:Uncharacterized protein n=1 Tax=Actinoallomurus bryophytorum TaxID=1490222 RepID=A0A543CG07_9ACTN|nr:hypothetical protein FB559_1558 [Actinoallomurus bryophytorum]